MELEACNLRMVKGQSQSESSFIARVIALVWSGLVWFRGLYRVVGLKVQSLRKCLVSLSRAIFLK